MRSLLCAYNYHMRRHDAIADVEIVKETKGTNSGAGLAYLLELLRQFSEMLPSCTEIIEPEELTAAEQEAELRKKRDAIFSKMV